MLRNYGRIPVRRTHMVALLVLISLLLTGTMLLEGYLNQDNGSQALEIQASE